MRIRGNSVEYLDSENIYKFYSQNCNKEYIAKQQYDFKSDLGPTNEYFSHYFYRNRGGAIVVNTELREEDGIVIKK